VKKPVPDYHTVTAHLILDEAAKAIDFYKRAFGAEEVIRMPGPDGKIAHAEIRPHAMGTPRAIPLAPA
jgi:PhnB protein